MYKYRCLTPQGPQGVALRCAGIDLGTWFLYRVIRLRPSYYRSLLKFVARVRESILR